MNEHSQDQMEAKLKAAGEMALAAAAKKGAAAEAFLLYDRELSLEVSGGEIQTLKQAEQSGLGIRIIQAGRVGFAYTSDLTPAAVEETVGRAFTIAGYTAADECNVLPGGNFTYPEIKTYDPAIASAGLEEKIELTRTAERAARAEDERVKFIERAAYNDNEFNAVIMNSEGVCASGRGNSCGLYVYLVAEQENDAQSGYAMLSSSRYRSLKAETVGIEAARRALRSLGARTIASAHLPCILEPAVAVRFMAVLSQMVDAGAVQKKKSMFADRMNQTVAAPMINLVDDGLYPEGIASFPFDGEGVPARKNTLIAQGILTNFLYDTYTARKAGRESTGNAQRSSFRSLPSVGISNFVLLPGEDSPEDLIGTIDRGVYITDVMGMHTVNPISGDFSVGAAGIMIEKGRLTFPVRGITIAGNLGQFFLDIEAVGSDLRFFGSRGAPTLRLKSLSIGGE